MTHEGVLYRKEGGYCRSKAHAAFDDVRVCGVEARLAGEPADEYVYAEEGGGVENAHAVGPEKQNVVSST